MNKQAPDHANCSVGEKAVREALYNLSTIEGRTKGDKLRLDDVRATLSAALAAMPTSDAIRAETTAQIVAWLRAQVSHPMGRGPTQNAIAVAADAIECGDHMTGGGE